MECEQLENAETEVYNDILKDLYHVQKQELYKIRREKSFSDEVIRKQELQIDLSDTKVINMRKTHN